MDNKSIATVLYETADLLEIDGQDSFRIRSYRNAAAAIEALPQQVTGQEGLANLGAVNVRGRRYYN